MQKPMEWNPYANSTQNAFASLANAQNAYQNSLGQSRQASHDMLSNLLGMDATSLRNAYYPTALSKADDAEHMFERLSRRVEEIEALNGTMPEDEVARWREEASRY